MRVSGCGEEKRRHMFIGWAQKRGRGCAPEVVGDFAQAGILYGCTEQKVKGQT